MQGAIAEDEGRFCRGLPLTPALGNRSRRCSTSGIHAVVSRREREKSGTHYLAVGSVI